MKRENVLNLCKLMIAGAWADGELDEHEVNAMKDLVFGMPDITEQEWTELDLYLDSPVSEEEREDLLKRVLSGISGRKDREFVASSMAALVNSDGDVSPQESEFIQHMNAALESSETDAVSRLVRMMRGAVKKRVTPAGEASGRERMLRDYVENRIYFQVKVRGVDAGNADELLLKKVCLAAGLLARVAEVDSGIDRAERDRMAGILAEQWGVEKRVSESLVDAACESTARGLDYFRLVRGFYQNTTREERSAFMKALFQIANSSGKTSGKEIDEIRRIAKSLKVPHEDYIDAKLTIPRAERSGL